MAKRIKPKRTQTGLGLSMPSVPKPAVIYGNNKTKGLVQASRKQMKENRRLAQVDRKAQVAIARAPYQAKIESARSAAAILGAKLVGSTRNDANNAAKSALENWRSLIDSNNAGDTADGEQDTKSTTSNLKGK